MASGDTAVTVRLSAGRTILRSDRGRWTRRSLSLLFAWIDRSRQRHALDALDDRLLADIGVTREAARREAARPFWLNGIGG